VAPSRAPRPTCRTASAGSTSCATAPSAARSASAKGKGDVDQAFFQRLNFRSTDVFTNPANGRTLTFESKELTNELTARRVSGSVFEFTTIEAGQPFTVRDSDGAIVLRDRGSIRHTVLFDTLGDSQPGGIELQDTIVRVSGPHPGLDQTEDEFCAMVVSLIG
jgi:hypothetical protein